jgi:hypothetical protein
MEHHKNELSNTSNILSEKFYLSFIGLETSPITVQASEQTLKAALESMVNIDNVTITRSSNVSEISWATTFLNNVGNLPLLEVHTARNTNPSFDLYVTELRAGTEPVFNSSSRDFGSKYVIRSTKRSFAQEQRRFNLTLEHQRLQMEQDKSRMWLLEPKICDPEKSLSNERECH